MVTRSDRAAEVIDRVHEIQCFYRAEVYGVREALWGVTSPAES